MPRRKEHVDFIRILFGDEIAERYEWVHKWKDEPSKWLGVKHRILRHSLFDNILLAIDEEGNFDIYAFLVGMIHDIQDEISTYYKRLYGRGKWRRKRLDW